MSLTVHGYLEQNYLSTPYLASTAEQTYGSQVNRTITPVLKRTGMQVTDDVVGFPKGIHSQVNRTIAAALNKQHLQVQRAIAATMHLGMQVTDDVAGATRTYSSQVARTIAGHLYARSMQVSATEAGETKTVGMQANRIKQSTPAISAQVRRFTASTGATNMSVAFSNLLHEVCQEYLVKSYLATPYLPNDICAMATMQVLIINTRGTKVGMQVVDDIDNAPDGIHTQVARTINFKAPQHSQVARFIKNFLVPKHAQVSRTINALKRISSQVARTIKLARPFHSQVMRVQAKNLHMEVTKVLYNTTNLRVLLKFPSRGTTGVNWSASSTAAGDFSPNNLNNDIVEFCWRGAAADTGDAILTCDTQIPQGVFVDTVGILNHNLTVDATVIMQGSNDSSFSSVGLEVTLTTSLGNMYYIAPVLPNAGFRYYRFRLQDSTNPANYLQVGTIVFGSAIIFIGDDILDQIRYSKKHFKDVIQTEGFTNITNDRALRKTLGMQFKDLDFRRGNYLALSNLFDVARTSLKCLWIPTPQYPTRFALFGKLVQLPDEVHNDKGEDINYIDLSVEIDESL